MNEGVHEESSLVSEGDDQLLCPSTFTRLISWFTTANLTAGSTVFTSEQPLQIFFCWCESVCVCVHPWISFEFDWDIITISKEANKRGEGERGEERRRKKKKKVGNNSFGSCRELAKCRTTSSPIRVACIMTNLLDAAMMISNRIEKTDRERKRQKERAERHIYKTANRRKGRNLWRDVAKESAQTSSGAR